MSAPLTAGAAALVISAYRSTHGGNSPTPALVKQLLTSTATDLGLPAFEQGSGLLNSRAAVEAALTYPGATSAAPAGVSSNIVLSTSQLDFSGAPGSTQSATVGVTNVGTKPLTVATSGRDFLHHRGVDPARPRSTRPATQTFPYPTTGAPWAYKKITFTIPAGTDRIAAQMIWQGAKKQVGTAHGHPGRPDLDLRPVRYLRRQQPPAGWRGVGQLRQPRPAQAGCRHVHRGDLHRWPARPVTPATSACGPPPSRPSPVGTISPPVLQMHPGQTKNVKVIVQGADLRRRHQLLGDRCQLRRSPDLDPGRGPHRRSWATGHLHRHHHRW